MATELLFISFYSGGFSFLSGIPDIVHLEDRSEFTTLWDWDIGSLDNPTTFPSTYEFTDSVSLCFLHVHTQPVHFQLPDFVPILAVYSNF